MTRAERVLLARSLYPDAFARVLDACRWAAADLDVQDHVARIVLVAHGGVR